MYKIIKYIVNTSCPLFAMFENIKYPLFLFSLNTKQTKATVPIVPASPKKKTKAAPGECIGRLLSGTPLVFQLLWIFPLSATPYPSFVPRLLSLQILCFRRRRRIEDSGVESLWDPDPFVPIQTRGCPTYLEPLYPLFFIFMFFFFRYRKGINSDWIRTGNISIGYLVFHFWFS